MLTKVKILAGRAGLLAAMTAAAMAAPPPAAHSAAGLADLGGQWRGTGTDRDSGSEQPQPVQCQATNRAQGDQVQIVTVCDGPNGREEISANLKIDGDRLTGKMTRRSPDLPFAVSGSVSGSNAGNRTTFDVRALFKTRARVVVAVQSAQSYRLTVTDPEDGATLMNVQFRKA
jgi:hypothetical protein